MQISRITFKLMTWSIKQCSPPRNRRNWAVQSRIRNPPIQPLRKSVATMTNCECTAYGWTKSKLLVMVNPIEYTPTPKRSNDVLGTDPERYDQPFGSKSVSMVIPKTPRLTFRFPFENAVVCAVFLFSRVFVGVCLNDSYFERRYNRTKWEIPMWRLGK